MLTRRKILLSSTILLLFTKQMVFSDGIAVGSTENGRNAISHYSTEPAATTSTVLDFDDVATSLGSVVMPTGYGGLSWENFYVADGDYPPFYNTGYRAGAVTPPKTAFNGSANPATIRSSTSFDFVEAYFTSAYAQTTEPYQVQVDGYLETTLKYSRLISVVTSGPTRATLNYFGIDLLVFTSLVNPGDGRRSQFVMDQFTYNRNSAVEPPQIFNASVREKKLFVSGVNFGIGAELLMNGKKQKKTYNDETDPTTILVGKKCGKLIEPGQTVTLQVRNPDGILSAEFSYTRPD